MILDYVPALEHCKRMAELGWDKYTMYSWIEGQYVQGDTVRSHDTEHRLLPSEREDRTNCLYPGKGDTTYHAPISTELMLEMPPHIDIGDARVWLELTRDMETFICDYWYHPGSLTKEKFEPMGLHQDVLKTKWKDFHFKNSANACAKLWIAMVEKELIKP